MTTNYDFDNGFRNEPQIPVPNATMILVLGILSITCCCYSVGIIPAIIAFVLASNAGKLYHAEPERYTQSSYSNMNAGKICAIIGLILSIGFAIYMVWVISYIGMEALRNPELLQERIQELMNQR